MSANNGLSSGSIIRISRKGKKKFAFGEEGTNEPFEVDVVEAFQAWIGIDESYRDDDRSLAMTSMPAYHLAAVQFVAELAGHNITVAEALDFLARLRETYDELADFFQPKSREKPLSVESSEVRFSNSEI